MKINKYKQVVEQMLIKAGVKINGAEAFDIQVKNEDFYKRVLAQGTLGLGEAYMDGWWESKKLDEFFFKVLRANLKKSIPLNWPTAKIFLQSKLFNLQNLKRSKQVALKHYDLSNKLYQNMLDPTTMSYTCGYWKEAKNLDQAQEAKVDLICRKIGLRSGMTVLDIGCGFGGFMRHAAKNYGAKVTGISISKEQIKLGEELSKGLDVEFKFMDYRLLEGKFDRVVSIEMIEAVGYKNYKIFFEKVHECLKGNGLFLLQTIGNKITSIVPDPWLNKYIFPNGLLPSLKQLTDASEKLFVLEDTHNFSAYYDKTLMAWFENFDKNWDNAKQDFDDRFYRMWKYYLLSCVGLFRARKIQLWQMVFSKEGVLGGYPSIR